MNLCFSTLGCTDRSLEAILSLAKTYGIGFLEVRGMDGELDNRKIPAFAPSAAPQTREAFRAAGVTPLVLDTSCAFHTPEKLRDALDEGRASLAIAKDLGFRALRVFGNSLVEPADACTARVIDGISTLCREAEGTGVDVLLEVHGDFNTVERLRPICDACGAFSSFGLIWDVCHTHKPYGAAWREFIRAFAPQIRHVHLKDVKNGALVLPGEGELELNAMVQTLLAEGYKGAFSLEWEKKWHPELPELEAALEALIKTLQNEMKGELL